VRVPSPCDLRIALAAASKLATQGDSLEHALSVLSLLDQLVEADDAVSQIEIHVHRATFLAQYGKYEEALGNIDRAWSLVREYGLTSHGVQVNRVRKGIEAAMGDDGKLNADDVLTVPAQRNRRSA
jgi:hypothetical protein